MKVKKKSYFGGGDVVNGNTTKLFYKDVLQNKFTILECFDNDMEEYEKFKQIWTILNHWEVSWRWENLKLTLVVKKYVSQNGLGKK